MQSWNMPLVGRKQIAEDTYELHFDRTQTGLEFTAGQYCTFSLHQLADKPVKEQFHDFSLSSSPNNEKEIVTIVRGSDSTYKKTLLTMPLGMPVDVEGPKGIFTLPEQTDRPIVFVAGGVGITPMLSMLRDNTEKQRGYAIHLLNFNTSKQRSIYARELQNEWELASKQDILGPIDDEIFEQTHLENPLWYISGPPAMVRAAQDAIMRSTSAKAGIDIRIEEFSGYQ